MAKICYPSVLLGRWWVFGDVKMMAWGYFGSMALVQWLYIHDIIVSYTDMIACTYSHLWLCYMTSSLAVPFNTAFWMSQQNRRFKSLILSDMLIDFYLCFYLWLVRYFPSSCSVWRIPSSEENTKSLCTLRSTRRWGAENSVNEELVRVCVDSYMFQQRPNPKGLTVTLGFQFHQVQHLRFRNFETCTKKNHPKKSSKSKQQKKDRIQVFKDFFSNRKACFLLKS